MVFRCLFPILYIEYMRIREKEKKATHTHIYAYIRAYRVFYPLETENGNKGEYITEKDVEQSLVKAVETAGNLAL